MKQRRVHVWITGRVQGVFFRAYARDTAQLLGITGWIRNLPGGTVEAVFEGDANKVEKMMEWCYEGSPLSRVDRVEVLDEHYTGDFDIFMITR
jgi:acylphosphatase